MTLILPYPPSVNHLYCRGRGGRVWLSKRGRDYRQAAATHALAQRARPAAGPIAVTLRVFRPGDDGDLDNVLKAALDAMNGIAWGDDGQIDELHLYRATDPTDPRIEMEIRPL